jgi:hypothetical protein
MATSYNDQWVLQRSSDGNTIVRRMSCHRAVAGTFDGSHGLLGVPAGPVRQWGVSSIHALPKAGRRDL